MIEILVVIAIIVILLAMLLPAVQAARAMARRVRCMNNLKQVAMAMNHFQQANSELPPMQGPYPVKPYDPGKDWFVGGAGGRTYGGWLAHLLPYLEHQPDYDKLPRTSPAGYLHGGSAPPIIGWNQSPDYAPPQVITSGSGSWQPGITGSNTFVGYQYFVWVGSTETIMPGRGTRTPIYGSVSAVGDPTPVDKWGWKVNDGDVAWMNAGKAYGAAVSSINPTFVQCSEDASNEPTYDPSRQIPVMASSKSTAWLPAGPLTNYLANLHVMVGMDKTPPTSPTNFDLKTGRILVTTGHPAEAAKFVYEKKYERYPSPFMHQYNSSLSKVTDGLSNTILLAEAMRRCDGGDMRRYAFWSSVAKEAGASESFEPNTHNFGMDYQKFKGSSDPDGHLYMGNTLMFQERPTAAGCNQMRVQSNHGSTLMVAMCDGSVRGIESSIGRRETTPMDRIELTVDQAMPTFGPADGPWDLLMMRDDGKN